MNSDEEICTSYSTGAIGRIAELHAVIYHPLCGFDFNFEIFVARQLADFFESFDPECDGIWLYKKSGVLVGCIAVDGHHRDIMGGRLRFLIIDPNHQRLGIGKKLMHLAIDFCKEKRMRKVILWSTPELRGAQGLYEQFGFKLAEEVPHTDWGKAAVHQRFELNL